MEGMNEDSVYFCGLRRGDKFYRILYVGENVGIIKRNKAQLQKNAAFNAMPGAQSDIDQSGGGGASEALLPLLL